MAPSNPFSYFRAHSKRNASSPSSPDVAPYANNIPSSSSFHNEFTQPPRIFDGGKSPQIEPSVFSRPLTLPSIPRIASYHGQLHDSALESAPPTPPPKSPGKDWGTKIANKVESWKESGRESSVPSSTTSGYSISRNPTRDAQGYGLSTQATQESARLDPTRLAAYGSQSYLANEPSPSSLYPPSSLLTISPAGENVPLRSPSAEGSHPPKSGRGRLNLLNPMTLLMRRRSHQTLDTSANESGSRNALVPAMTLPEDYDPRIRGNKVHDFSAPRKRTTPPVDNSFSFGSHGRNDITEGQRDSADSSPSKADHTPIFKENFDDDLEPQEMDRVVRAEQLANQGFLKRVSMQPPSPPDRTPPSFPDDSGPSIAIRRSVSPPEKLKLDTNKDLPLSPVRETDSFVDDPKNGASSPKSPRSPPVSRSRAASGTDPYFQSAGIPQHTASKASRFSFQILGNDSAAQEKLLEERHKQKAAAKALADGPSQTDEFAEDDYDEDAMYEEMMNEDGIEEEIPGMEDEDELGYGGYSGGYGGLANDDLSTFGTHQTFANPTDMSDNHSDNRLSLLLNSSQAGGASLPNLSIQEPHVMDQTTQDTPITEGSNNIHGNLRGGFRSSLSSHDLGHPPNGMPIGSDDLYFDDGMIDDPVEDDGEGFDESVFDDPTNHLYERRPAHQPSSSLDGPIEADLAEEEPPTLAPRSSVRRDFRPDGIYNVPITDPIADLENLNLYHGALAEAANKAAASGRFIRHSSVDLSTEVGALSPAYSQSDGTSSSRPSLIPDEGRYSTSTAAPFSPPGVGTGVGFPVEDDYGYDGFDGDLEDDPMIAEANAEALACNYEEDYGQEFGFYASGQGDAVFSNGGYFGPREQMLGRSTSGRNAVQEPNLTPITERSEYSTRNSFISISNQYPWHGQGPQALTSPGLAQLARMSPSAFPEDDSDISLEQLRKLRRGAFGDSSTSLKSAGSSPRNSLPGDVNFPKHSSGLVNGTNFIQWDLEHSSMHGASDGVGPESSRLESPIEEEDPETLDAVNALSSSESEFDPDNDNHNSFHGSYLEDDAEDNDSPTITDFAADVPAAPLLSSPPLPTSIRPASLNIPAPTTSPSVISSPISPSAPQLPSLILPIAPMSPFTIAPPWANSTPPPQISQTSPVSMSAGPHPLWKTHSRKSSAADSVTYVRERDEAGEQRWVLERRRTASTGEMELVGREIVEGGRI